MSQMTEERGRPLPHIPGNDDIALELCALSRVFRLNRGLFSRPGEIRAVDNVSLRIRRGETLGLVGESGCGKSTLAKMLLGLLPPTSGNVLIEGREIDAGDRRELASRIQPIFQDPYSSLNPRRTVADIVEVALRLHNIGTPTQRKQRVREMLDVVGMPERTHGQYPGQLSGGQRQRVAIARALILQPEILICDEPTSALDVSVQRQVLNIMDDLVKQRGMGLIFISHDLNLVSEFCDRVLIMYAGRIVEVCDADKLHQATHPYTRGLLNSLPRLDQPRAKLEVLSRDPAWSDAPSVGGRA